MMIAIWNSGSATTHSEGQKIFSNSISVFTEITDETGFGVFEPVQERRPRWDA